MMGIFQKGTILPVGTPSLHLVINKALTRFIRTKIWRMDIHPSACVATSALLDRTWPRGVHIGEGAVIGEEVVLLTHDVTRGLFLHTRIGARTILLPRSMILPGLTLGVDCIVMPGAVVTKDIPPGSIAVGNPATVRPRDDDVAPERK